MRYRKNCLANPMILLLQMPLTLRAPMKQALNTCNSSRRRKDAAQAQMYMLSNADLVVAPHVVDAQYNTHQEETTVPLSIASATNVANLGIGRQSAAQIHTASNAYHMTNDASNADHMINAAANAPQVSANSAHQHVAVIVEGAPRHRHQGKSIISKVRKNLPSSTN
tara:strand:+ start:964 stop:1464 length:501 start_codon:yes stop_codon:yes gene_type:complete